MRKILFALAMVIGIAMSCSDKPGMAAFEEIETKVYDIGAKSQITRHIVLQDSIISKEQLSYTLETLVKACENTKMKYNNGKATHISIYIHTTKETYDSGIWTNCIASYTKIGVNDQGKYTYR